MKWALTTQLLFSALASFFFGLRPGGTAAWTPPPISAMAIYLIAPTLTISVRSLFHKNLPSLIRHHPRLLFEAIRSVNHRCRLKKSVTILDHPNSPRKHMKGCYPPGRPMWKHTVSSLYSTANLRGYPLKGRREGMQQNLFYPPLHDQSLS